MARIRHIAIGTQDPDATARFYKEGLGLKEVGRLDSKTAEGYYLSDGHVNVAILKFKSDDPATTEGGTGGPMFDDSETVVAVNAAILVSSETGQSFSGSSFAIPISSAVPMIRRWQGKVAE